MANKIEGLIVKIKDTSASSTGDFSIAKLQIFSNDKTLIPVDKYCPAMKMTKQLKDYYEVDSNTYKMVNGLFSQSPNFTATEGYQYQVVPFNWTDATEANVKSTEVSVGTFQPLSDASIRIKVSNGVKELTKEVNGINFSSCETLDDVVSLLNSQGLDCVFEVLTEEDKNYLVIKSKGLGSNYSINVESCISPSVVIDLQNVCFGSATSATTTTPALTDNLDNFKTIGDGKLTISIDGVVETRYNFDFTSCTSIDDVAKVLTEGANETKGTSPVVLKPFTGVTFSVINDKIVVKTTSTGSTSSVALKSTTKTIDPEETGDDIYGANYLKGSNQVKVAGSDGVVSEKGTDGAGDSIVELYQQYDNDPDFNGSVITTNAKMSLKNIVELNNQLKSSATNGFRMCMVLTLQDPLDCEKSQYGEISDWLDARYLNLYCGGLTGTKDLLLRSAVMSIATGQDVTSSNQQAGTKYDMHLKDVTIDGISTSDISLDNDLLDTINSAGVGGLGYFKQGFGWKLTIPSGEGQYTFADSVNMHNICMSISIKLANILATNKYTNKTNSNLDGIKNALYRMCDTFANNGVLSGDVSDFSQISVDMEKAKTAIVNNSNHTYIYIPDASTISGKKIPITMFMGFAGSVYGFELENVYLN